MNIEICNNSYTYVWNKHIPLNAWYGQDETGWWMCTAHGRSKDKSLELYRLNGTRWTKSREISDTTRKIWEWAEVHRLWWTTVHWFHEEDKIKSFVTKQHHKMSEYENMMK